MEPVLLWLACTITGEVGFHNGAYDIFRRVAIPWLDGTFMSEVGTDEIFQGGSITVVG